MPFLAFLLWAGPATGQAPRLTDSTAVVWASLVPTFGAGTGSVGRFVGSAVALGFLISNWEVRGTAGTSAVSIGCAGSCPLHVGTLLDAAILWRPERARHHQGPFIGLGAGYSYGAKVAAVSGLAGGDLSLSRRLLFRLEAKYTEALTGAYVMDPESPNPRTRSGARQLVISVGIGVVGPFY